MNLTAKLTRPLEIVAHKTAQATWPIVEFLQSRFQGGNFVPPWAPAPLVRKRSKPPLGWPRETDSLCPRCVKEVREAIVDGETDWKVLLGKHPGEIKAQIVERDGQIVMEKSCPKHGAFSDLVSMDPKFLERIERVFPGRDFLAPPTHLRDHGASTIKYGRGSVLTIDLTNRCNMMCDPCFMDANQVGYVHELTIEDVRKILDDAISIKPRRQMSVQFSGGEPTLHPHFIEATRYAREVGYFCVQCATNGIRFAEDPGFAQAAAEAGLRVAYLQFDGTDNESNAHRKIGNLFDVKLRAIENLHRAGVTTTLVVTVVNGVNNHQVGPIIDFAVANPDKVGVISFQPVSFTGRDEDITDERRRAQRYTLSHLAHDVKAQTGRTEPLRDWFPLSALGPFSDLVDLVQGPDSQWGSLKCGCHPNCGVGTILFVNKKTKQMVPLSEFIDMDQFLVDVQAIADAGHARAITLAKVALALLRSYDPRKAPAGYNFPDLMRQFLSQTGAKGVGKTEGDHVQFEWRVLFVAGMWFQDLFNYDFRRTEMCIIPYGTQIGEVSFCAYNTGVGFRQVVEKIHRTAELAEWYAKHGKHPVYAKGQDLSFPGLGEHSVAVPARASGNGQGNGEPLHAEKAPKSNGAGAHPSLSTPRKPRVSLPIV